MRLRPWKTLASRTLLERPPWLTVGEEQVELPDGRVIDYLRLRLRDYAVAVALTPSRELVVERSYKHGPRSVTFQLPAGLLEDGEDPLEAAKRELLEETGYASDDWRSLGRFIADSNYGANWAHAFLALDARRVAEPRSGDLEEIEVSLRPLEQVMDDLRAGTMALLSSAAALALAYIEIDRQ